MAKRNADAGVDGDLPEAPDDPDRVDVLACRFPAHDDREDRTWTVPAGWGERVVEAHEVGAAKRRRMRTVLKWVLAAVLGAGGWLLVHPALGVVLAVVVAAVVAYAARITEPVLPEVVATDLSPEDARAMWDAGEAPDSEAMDREGR